MNRTTLYSKVKQYGLADHIKAVYKKNFTNVCNDILNSVITAYETKNVNTQKEDASKVRDLIEVLYKKHILCKAEYDNLVR